MLPRTCVRPLALLRILGLVTATWIGFVHGPAHATLIKIDFAVMQGAPDGWDAFENFAVDDVVELTDRSGLGDDDVTLTVLDDGFSPNNPAPPTSDAVYDTVPVPLEVLGDYLFKTVDAAGTSARFRFDNLDPGTYNVTVFEGRTTDASQFAKIWVSDETGANEPAAQNTGSFAQTGQTVSVAVQEGDVLWYRHLEDNSGGISGMIIRRLPELVGDFNADGVLDNADYDILLMNFQSGTTFAEGDFNFDGKVSLLDFVGFVDALNNQNAAAVPEPQAWLLALLGGSFLLRYRRVR